ncbi:two-component system sensor histidine kinase YesM [Paenibacillus forsythiae]|uniref:Two-component system sensor histidine kinase YesM n=1 Tax=Paenibacillus forsythiae TaxID=365616 RepID=A0ABU3HD13_9BACL|nr:sensor histidine kinase [Paenibacillus forsythiae]MDT3428707.1 two-component system sensor histidine kinase YesM [Paenibacillus forsythiae]
MLHKLRVSNRFTSKIILVLLLVIIIPTLFTSLSFYWLSDSILKKNVRESTIQIAKQTAESLSFILDVGIDTSDFIAGDVNIQRAAMKLGNSPSYEESWNFQYINTLLNNYVYSNSFVKIVYLLKEEGKGWGSGTFSDQKLKEIQLSDQEWVKEAKRKNGELVWQGLQYDHFSGGGVNTDLVLPVARVLKDFNTMRTIGLVQVHLDGQSVVGTIRQLELGKTGKFFVVDSEGRIMIDSNLDMINKRVENPDLYKRIVGDNAVEFEFHKNGVPYYGVKQLLSNGWMIVGTVPVAEISGPLNRLQTWILLSSAAFSLIAIGIGLFIARWVTQPVKQLTQSMLSVQNGDLQVRAAVRTSDEIGFLSKQFNKMLLKIENLMQQVEDEQSEKYHAELRAAMHRIHPHFLYNTLSTLRWLIDSRQNDRASEVLSALNHLLEANMGKSGSRITVEEELDIIRKYLIILELRYERTFWLELDVEPGTEKLVIPRMLLQPLVENAIFHGIVPKNTDGRISIRIRKYDRDLEFLMEDDGLGIGEDKLKVLNRLETAAENGEIGIGLRHIYDILRLYYARNWTCSFTSRPGQGTAVRIVLQVLSEASSKNEQIGGNTHVQSTYRRR